jgi:catechol 2,3-dioxygenase-like lactoylglutathione lyase family enzyme
MAKVVAPEVECEQQHAELVVKNVLASVRFYEDKLGFKTGFTWGEPVTMAGVNIGQQQIFLHQGTPNPKGIGVSFLVGNADELYEFHRAGGVEVLEPIDDREYGIRDYRIKDIDGYNLSFGHHLFTAGEPIPIERVDVPLRLEKRLAALLLDLATHKRMSLSSCVEEILLHTNEPLGDGVASPHTKGTLRHIQELKKKHGIDYDSHGSYRFAERK